MKRILLFGGTTEARSLLRELEGIKLMRSYPAAVRSYFF